MLLLFNTSPVVSCDSTMSLDHISLYRDLKVTEIRQHVITCHRPCELMLARVKMDGRNPGAGVSFIQKGRGVLVVPFSC